MDNIVILEGEDLKVFFDYLGVEPPSGVYRLRFAVEGGIKVKANEAVWSPPLGKMVN